MSVPHVHAKDLIGNTLAIKLRLAADSDFTSVSFVNGATATKVTIDTTGLAAGSYTVALESYDTNAGVYSTLKLDTVTIQVTEPSADPFDELEVVTLVANQSAEWQLPELDLDPSDFLIAVFIIADPPLEESLTYEMKTNSIQFDGALNEVLVPIVTSVSATITIVTSWTSQSYEQQITLLPVA